MKKTEMLNVPKHQAPPKSQSVTTSIKHLLIDHHKHEASNTQVSTKILSLHFTNPPQAKYLCSSNLFLQKLEPIIRNLEYLNRKIN
jgi:hypothetical protein